VLAAAERRLRPVALPVGVLIGALVAWEVAWRLFDVPRFVVPLPSGIIAETWEWRGRLLGHAWVTLYETLAGFALSIAVGVPLAVMIVYSPILRSAVYPLLVVTQAVPKVAIAPVLLLLLGAGGFSKIVVAFLVAFFPIVVDTATGLAATPPELLELSRSYRASPLKTFVKVRFPMALPFVFSGLKVAVTLAVIGAVVGEFVGSDQGLGYVIVSATSYWKSNLAFGAMLLLAVMAIGLFALVELAERLICPWYAFSRDQVEAPAK
jgi:NitT/TauT family transport system permease protein